MFRDRLSTVRYEWSKFRGLEMDGQCSEVNGQSLEVNGERLEVYVQRYEVYV